MKSFFLKLDPREQLASTWEKSSLDFEENITNRSQVSSKIKLALISEKQRIQELFSNYLPSKKDKVFIVITNDAIAQSCSIFAWKGKIYVLVSAALLGAPIDFPNIPIKEGWKWLALHEISHFSRSHLPLLFHTRRLFRLLLPISIFLYILSFFVELSSLYSIYLLLVGWTINLLTALACELQADFDANNKASNSICLIEAKGMLERMTDQAINRFAQPIGWINYLVHTLFLDPHPPLKLRLYLINRRIRSLQK